MHKCTKIVKWLPNCFSNYLSLTFRSYNFWAVVINWDGTRTLCSYIFAPKPEWFLGIRSHLSASICFISYTNEAKLVFYWQCLIDVNSMFVGRWFFSIKLDIFLWQLDTLEPDKSCNFKLLRISNLNCLLLHFSLSSECLCAFNHYWRFRRLS